MALWVRAESLEDEKRCALTPSDAKKLCERGITVYVEKCPNRIFENSEYESVGCILVNKGEHIKASCLDFVLGIKALSHNETPISQQHIYFAHAYKQQNGAKALMKRFKDGNGCLYDLEYLVDQSLKRVCYFGYWSGISAACLSLLYWCSKYSNTSFKIPQYYPSLKQALSDVSNHVKRLNNKPRCLVIGHKGNCGTGVKSILSRLELPLTLWDIEETKSLDSFDEVYQHDIFFNAIYLNPKTPKFIRKSELNQSSHRQLRLICDISCDPNNIHNPLPVYDSVTSFKAPAHNLNFSNIALDIIAIENMPSFLPRESSAAFSKQLLPYLLQLFENNEALPFEWERLKMLYLKKAQEILHA